MKRPPKRAYVLPVPTLCEHCGAKLFRDKTINLCCSQGEIRLAPIHIPDSLRSLFVSLDSNSESFRKYIILYNNMFALTSLGVKKDKELAQRYRGIYTFRVQGQVYHYINDIHRNDEQPRYLQLYFYDTDAEFQRRVSMFKDLDPHVIGQLMRLMELNPYAQFFRSLKNVSMTDTSQIIIRSDPNQDQRAHNAPTTSQVAAIWLEDAGSCAPLERDIVVRAHSGVNHHILHYYGCYDPLQYPLLFPYGETGWHRRIYRYKTKYQKRQECPTFPINEVLVQTVDDLLEAEEQGIHSSVSEKKVSCREYYCYRLQIRIKDSSFLLRCGRLLQQFIVDMYIKIETSRLDFIRRNQDTIRAELYQGILDSLNTGILHGSNIGCGFILPPSFIGGPRDMRRRYLDAMALVQHYGKPDIFLTMTCNPSWPEITDELLPTEEAQNRPDLIARVFHAKLAELKKDIVQKKLFGEVVAYVYVIEFQKRGLPHAHFLIILESSAKIGTSDQFDEHVCAEIPEQEHNPHLYEAVLKHMMHDPCGSDNPGNVCMRNGKCKSHYPRSFSETTSTSHNSYPIYRRRDDEKKHLVRKVQLDNRWVIPYNPYLLAKYDCHINIEVCSTVKAVKYLYKYIYKGHDRVVFALSNPDDTSMVGDEISSFQKARWVSPPEAAWRIFRFPLNGIHPPVVSLQVHLPNMQTVTFCAQENLQNIASASANQRTMLTAFFEINQVDAFARTLLYQEFSQHYTWHPKKSEKFWQRRRSKATAIGRIVHAHPSEGERFYLRLLLARIRGPTSFDYLLTFNNIRYSSFREAAFQRGLLEADDSIDKCLQEACQSQMPFALRRLFATLLVHCNPEDPNRLWEKYYQYLSEDYSHNFPTDKKRLAN